VHDAVALDNRKRLGDELQESGFLGTYQLPVPKAFLEINIEQGPVLAAAGIDIGIVTGVTGIVWKEVTILGQANHAGTTPIPLRKDSGLAAAEVIQYARELSLATDGRITVGRMRFEPNVTNIIPEKVAFTLDIRHTNQQRLLEAVSQMDTFLEKIANKHNVEIQQEELVNVNPVDFDHMVIDAGRKSTESLLLKGMEMPSGAGHDAQLMAGCCPSGMIFIPSRNGISHNKDEYSSGQQIENGVNVLLHSVLNLL
jgi:N-carbamoyl-L-amino-acid hydrolase